MSKAPPKPSHEEVQAVQRLFAKERLSIDDAQPGRTCFLSHLGAQPKLSPGPWIGHRDLLYALALANLSPAQRTSLARAVLVDHNREFGVGRLRLEAFASGLPFGGSSVRMQPVIAGPTCLYTWALGTAPASTHCDWLLLRAQPEWALDEPPPPLRPGGIRTLVDLGGEVLVLLGTAVDAVSVAQLLGTEVPLAAHPRFAPYLEGLDPDAPVLLWPHDALDGAGLRRRQVVAVVLVAAPEAVHQQVLAWRSRGGGGPASGPHAEAAPIKAVACPARAGRPELASFWKACGRPKILLTGDPAWAASGARWLRSLGAFVEVQGEATQLELL